ncbi:MAG: ribonuclease Z [Gemmatimonadota bacterium]
MSTLTVLGSGNLLPHPTRGSAGHAVEWGDGSVLLLDCGAGVLKGLAQARLPWERITLILLSHYHTDHVGDLLSLLWAFRHGGIRARQLPLTVVGPPGLHALWQDFRTRAGRWVDEASDSLHLRELPDSCTSQEIGLEVKDLKLRTHPVRHSRGAVAWRIEMRDGQLGYTGDTGPYPGLDGFFRNVDVLVSECGQWDPPGTPLHFSPSGLAAMAAGARPGLLVLTHRPPGMEGEQALDLLRRAGYTGRAVAPMDGFRVPLVSPRNP